MKDSDKIKNQLLNEIDLLKTKIAVLKKSENKHKKKEHELQESREIYRIIMEASLQGISKVDPKGCITFANPAVAELSGYSLIELDGMSLDTLYPSGKAKVISDINVALLHSGKSIIGENTMTRKDGRNIETYFSCAPVFDENGEYAGFIASILDITERKQAEEKLRAANQQLTASEQQLKASNQQLTASEQQLKVSNQQLIASEQQLKVSNQQLIANEQQLRSANQQLTASEQQLRSANQQLEASNRQLIASEEEIKKHAHDLDERVKELNCLYGITESIKTGETIEEILHDTANIIPPAWQYPEITRSKVRFDEKEYISQTFKESKWKQSADIIVNGRVRGSIEVYYLEECPKLEEGPFLKEERNLINILAKNISEAIEHKQAEEELKASNQQLTASEQQLKTSNQQLTASEQQLRASMESIKKSEERYRSLVTNIPDIVWTTDCEGKTSYISSNIEDIYGYTPEEVYENGDSIWFGRIHPEDVGRVEEAFKKLFEKETMFDVEYRIKRKDEEWMWLHDKALKVYEKDGIKYADGIFSDITEHKLAEETLQKSESQYRLLAKNAVDFIFYMDLKFKFIYVSPYIYNSMGYYPEEVIGTRLFKYTSRREFIKIVRVAFRTVKDYKSNPIALFETELINKKGEEVPVEISGRVVLNKKGRPIGIQGNVRDITERKQAEIALKESEYEKTLVLDNMSELIVYKNTNMETVWASKSVSELLDITPEENIGQVCYKVRYNRNTPCPDCKAVLVLKTGKIHQYESTSPDGRCWFVRCSPVHNESNEIIGTVEVSLDITERKKAELNQLVLYNISNAVNTTKNLDELYKIIHQQLGNIIDTTNFYIANYYEETDEIISPYFIDEKVDIKVPHQLRKNGVTNYIIKNAKSLFLTVELRKELIKKGEIADYVWTSKTLLGVPLKIENRVVGCVVIRSYEESIFSEKDLSILEFVSSQIAIAIARKQAEEKIEHLNAVLNAIRNVNQLIIQEKNRKILIQKVCENFIENRGFQSAWIALFDEKSKLIHFEGESLDKNFQKLKENISNTNLPRCINKTLQQDDVVSIKEAGVDCNDCPIVEIHKGKNRSVLSRSLKYGSKCYGVLSVSLPSKFIADKEEQSLFDEVAGDIAYALYNIEVEEQRQKAEEALAKKTMLLDNIINRASNIAIATTDLDLRITSYNPIAEKFFGYTPEEVLGRTVVEMHLKEKVEPERLEKAIEIVKKTGEYNYIVTQELESEKRVLSSRVTGMLDPAGKLVGYVLFSRDITELEIAEEALLKSENNLRALFNAMIDIVFEVNYDGRIINVAPTSPELVFKPTEDIIDKTLHEIFPKPQADKFLEFIRKCLDENKTAKIEYPLVIDNKTMWFEGRGTPKTKNSVLYIARDVTDRKKAEKALAESEHNLRSLFNAMTDVVFEMDYDGRYINIAPTSPELMFKPPKDIIGKTLHEVFPKPEADKFLEFIRKCLAENKTVILEYPLNIDDKTIWFEGSATPKTKNSVLYIARDITERKQAEEALHESEEKFRNFVETSADLVFRLNKTGHIDYVSPRVKELYGYQPDELIGKSLRTTTPIGEVRKAIKALNMILAGKSLINIEINQKTKAGRVIPMEINAVPVYQSGKIVGLQGIMRDITERKQAENVQKALYEISDAINTTDDLHVLCQQIREFLGNVIDTTNFYVALYDEKTDMISLPFDIDEKDNYETFPAGKSLTAYVIETGKSLLVDNKLLTKLIKEGKIEDIGTPSKIWLGAPLKIENKVIGVVVVQSYDDPNLYTESDIDILTYISEAIALAIDKKRAEQQIKRSLKEKTILLQELYHRTKNNMQLISSLLKIQSRSIENRSQTESMGIDFLLESFSTVINKIKAMSLVHQKLYQSQDLSHINLKEYIKDLVRLLMISYGIRSENITLKLELEDVFVLIDSAIPLGLVLNELISNVFKHAFPYSEKDEIFIRLYKEKDETINIHLRDNGTGIPSDLNLENVNTMGLQTVFDLIKYQLMGEVKYKAENGLKWDLSFKDNLHKERV